MITYEFLTPKSAVATCPAHCGDLKFDITKVTELPNIHFANGYQHTGNLRLISSSPPCDPCFPPGLICCGELVGASTLARALPEMLCQELAHMNTSRFTVKHSVSLMFSLLLDDLVPYRLLTCRS